MCSLVLEGIKSYTCSASQENATTSCKNVHTLCAKNGFTYLDGLQITNLSQNNN